MIRRLVPVLVLAAALAAGCSRQQPAPHTRTAAASAAKGPREWVMGLERLKQGNTYGAAFLFEKAALAYPESLSYSFKLAETYTTLGADDKDYFQKAAQVYDDLEPVVGEDDERLLMGKAALLEAQQAMDPALEIYEKLLNEHKDDCKYWVLLGQAQIKKAVVLRGAAGLAAQMDELETAEKTYQHAIDMCPDQYSSYWGKAVLLEAQKDYDGLIALYQDLVQRFPDNPEVLRRYTYAFYMKRDWAGAAKNFEKLLKQDYDLEDHRNYIVCLDKLGRNKEEEEQIKLYKATAPKPEGPVYLTDMDRLRIKMDVNPMTDKAGNLFEDGKYQEAIDLWKKARGIAQDHLDDPEFGKAAQEFTVWLDRRITLAERRLSGDMSNPIPGKPEDN